MFAFIQKITHTLFQPTCLLCDSHCINQQYICDDCFSTLPINTHYCKRCGLPLSDSTICNACVISPPPLDNTLTLFDYQTPIPELIWKLKYNGDLKIARWFGNCWIDMIKKHYAENTLPQLIMPVPLHHQRLKERGFNQALEIAKPIGQHFNIPIDTHTCIRLKNTVAQSTLTAKKRRSNVTHAFALSYRPHVNHIAILDDVMTTGSTVSAIATLLKMAGVQQIDVWCCARAH